MNPTDVEFGEGGNESPAGEEVGDPVAEVAGNEGCIVVVEFDAELGREAVTAGDVVGNAAPGQIAVGSLSGPPNQKNGDMPYVSLVLMGKRAYRPGGATGTNHLYVPLPRGVMGEPVSVSPTLMSSM
jgi:hypothetical protein